MWDSAKKPIKVRSVLQSNGMRHFIVNEENEDIHSQSLLQQQKRRNSNKTIRSSISEGDTFDRHQSSNEIHSSTSNEAENGTLSETSKKVQNRYGTGNSCPPLFRSNTLNDADDRWATTVFEQDRNFFGVSGSKISNSKKHKGQHSRYIHQFPHASKSNVEMTKYPQLIRADVLDLVPVKSPVIKKLISGRNINTDNHPDQLKHQRVGNNQTNGPPSTMTSRIMAWIDLEVKRNAGKGKSSTSLPYNATGLDIVNELVLPGDYDLSKMNTLLTSISDNSSTSSSSSESTNASSCISSSSSGSCTSSSISLPKLTPCWRKEGNKVGSKTKKSVRIAEDLPRWGNMKRRLRRKTLSLNELYEEESLSYPTYYDCSNKTDYISNKLKSRKEYCSVADLVGEESKLEAEGGEDCTEEKTTDSFLVRDERLLTSGKLQVHIFLPQTESACSRVENSGNLSGRSEDSTS